MTTLQVYLTGRQTPLFYTLEPHDAEEAIWMFRSQQYFTLLINGDVLATAHIAAIIVRDQKKDPS